MPWVAQRTTPIAIAESDYLKYGCPICGTRNVEGYSSVGKHGTSVVDCYHCNIACFVCGDEDKESFIWPGDHNGPLTVELHPLRNPSLWSVLQDVVRGIVDQLATVLHEM